MGLDLVELVIRTEEVFNITIDNSDAEQVRTAGDLYGANTGQTRPPQNPVKPSNLCKTNR